MSARKTTSRYVLLIEDNAMVAMMLQKFLEQHSCKVTVAETGKKALKYFDTIKFDLIFSDVNLPDMKGFDIAREIRKKEINLSKRTPIIGMSTEDCKQKALASGMDDFYQKPLSHEKIAEILKMFV